MNAVSIDPDFSGVTDPHLVCAVLKQYLRELPEPVVAFRFYEDFLEVARNAGTLLLTLRWAHGSDVLTLDRFAAERRARGRDPASAEARKAQLSAFAEIDALPQRGVDPLCEEQDGCAQSRHHLWAQHSSPRGPE